MERNLIEFVNEKNFNKLKERVRLLKSEGKKIVFYSGDDDLNRKVIEKLDVDCLLIEYSGKKDFMKQRDSGFNEIFGKVMAKKEICLGVDFKEILVSKKKEVILSKIKQNISLCKRLKIQIRFFNFGNKKKKDLKSLGIVLGMPTWMLKELV